MVFLFSFIPYVKATDSITYSSVSNRITVIGTYTNLHWELWNASTVNGWNVVHKLGEVEYLINNTYIQIGDGVTTTVCSDLSVNVLFETNQQWAYFVKYKGTLTFGQQDSGYATSHGVNINFNSSHSAYGERIFEGTSSALSKLYLYSCSLKSTYNDNPDNYIAGIVFFSETVADVVIYNCFFDKVYVRGYCDIYNLAIFRSIYGVFEAGGTLEQIFLYDVFYAIAVSGTSKTVKDVNIIAVDSSTGVRYTGGGNDHYLINVDWSGASNWKFYWHNAVPSNIFRQYEFDLTVTYPNGTAINGTETGARVTIQHYGEGGGIDYNATLNGDGSINQTALGMGFYNQTGGDTLYSYNPFNIEVSNITGYLSYSKNFTLTKKTQWEIALIDESEAGYAGYGFLFFGLIAGLVVGVLVGFGTKH